MRKPFSLLQFSRTTDDAAWRAKRRRGVVLDLCIRVSLVLVMLAHGSSVEAQMADCATPDVIEPQLMGGSSSCDVQGNYVPDQTNGFQNTPNLVLKVNYHFIRPTDGSGPYAGDMSAMVVSELASLNGYYNDLAAPALPVSPAAEHIVDSRVRYVLQGVYYHDDDARYAYYFTRPHPNCSNDLRTEFGVDVDRVINIFFYSSQNGRYGCGLGSMAVNMINCMPFNDTGLLAHELGHVVGLSHTFFCGSSSTACGDDTYSDTYWPDCNHNAEGCGPDVQWSNAGSSCPLLTGVGISNNIMGYNSCRRYFSPLQLARVQKNLITTASKRMYVLCEEHPFDPTITVSNSAVWETSKIINANIEVEPGKTLDVRCTLYMSPHAKIIVKPGGRLIVDGGTLTAHSGGCDTFWGGIEVWGNANQHQYPASQPDYQGIVILKNGAIVEHAREAIRLWKPNDWESMGGVVQVQGTSDPATWPKFINCRRSAEFMKYQNFQPGNPATPRPNLSYFNYAQFIVDDDYRGGDDFEGHVSLWAVDGVSFRACGFKNEQNTVTDSQRLGEGILSLDANYSVGANCTVILPYGTPCPDEDLDRGNFEGLGTGIYALDGGSGRGFAAGNLDFNNNIVGLYTEGLPGFSAVRNHFTMGDRLADMTGEVHFHFQEQFHRGISTQMSHGFRIEENSFTPAANIQANGVDAIVIENSESNSTQVYKNSATGMNSGYIAEGNCMDPMNASAIGHEFACNTNTGNQQNFWVRKDDQDNDTWDHSERTQQGSNDVPAGNTFDQGSGETDYKNETAWVINYWHQDGVTQPVAVTSGWVGVTLANGGNNCPSRLGGKEVKLNAAHRQEAQNAFVASKTAYVNTAYVYQSLLDGGNTPAVVQEVEESWPQDAWDLRNYLMSKSPYLSTEVLQEMMIKNILPQAMVLEVCLANPEATKKDGFTKWAEYEAPAPLPGYMIDLIAGSWAPKTFRMELEAQMGRHHANMSVAADMLQAAYRLDEEAIPVDAMLAQWNAMPNYGARFAEAELLMRKGQYDAARTMIQGLGDRYPMKGDREAERDRTVWYINQLQALENSDRSMMQLTAGELAQWQAFAENANDIPGNWAGNVLCFGYKICVERAGSAGGANKSLRPRNADALSEVVPSLSVAPNPATSWATFTHALTTEPSNAHVRIVDASGREVGTLPINAMNGQLLWDTREVPAGLYTVELFNGGARLATERLVVQPAK